MGLVPLGGMVRLFGTLGADTPTDKGIGCCMQWVCVDSARLIGLTTDLRGFERRRWRMTNEEAIEILKEEHDWVQEPCYVIKAIELAINALSKNTGEPLTVDQLREMDRPTPVWAEVKGKAIEGWDGYWCLCQNGKILAPSRLVAEAERMDGVEFYAYPPAHIDREALCGTWEGEADGYADGELVYDVWRCGDCGYVEKTDDPDLLPRFCPPCGRAMIPDAWTELEKRMT